MKKALLLQLLGGVEKNLETGVHLRGDINVLMVGDPSTAKSQLLRHVMDIAPLCVNTTGKGSSGVGLTAAVVCDKDTGERHLEAGAMVLADRGVVCIDEFDKMNDVDRVAIHEVMEQQTVTIAKGGLHVSLNARCSVVAAANPVYGDYAPDLAVGRNIGMPDSLLSRFDLLFVMLDEKNPDKDRRIAQRVIANHRYLAPNTELNTYNYAQDDVVVEAHDFDKVQQKLKRGEKVSIFEKGLGRQNEEKIVTREFLKKYIAYAKSQKSPEITSDAIELASNAYAAFRAKNLNMQTSMPITVRTLESIIRLATAHAKLRLSKTVEINDIDMAMTLIDEALFQNKDDGAKQNSNEDDEDEDMYDEEAEKENKAVNNNRNQRYASRHGDLVQLDTPKNPEKTNKRMRRDEKSPIQPSPSKDNSRVDPRPTKRLRTNEESTPAKEAAQEIKKLIQAAPQKSMVDLQAKKFLYKLMTENKDPTDKVGVDLLYRKYMMAPDQDVLRKGKALIKDKREMLEIIEEMEKENLVMFSPADGQVVII